jgi:multicomponent Na+:H+ antiporter subunit C
VTRFTLYAFVAVVMIAIAAYRLLTARHLLRKIVTLNVIDAAIFLLLIAVGYRNQVGGEADPVPQTIVLTGIVVAVGISAFAITIARRLYAETGDTAVQEEDRDLPDHLGDQR